MKKILLAICALALALGSAMPVSALTTTANMSVSLTVIPVASVSVTNMSFGTVLPGATSITGNSTITVNATSGLAYTVTLDAGLNLNTGIRTVASGATLGGAYRLYKDSAHSTEWGDSDFANTYGYGSGVAGTGSGANQTLTVYGLSNAGSTPGAYTDTVTVTVNY